MLWRFLPSKTSINIIVIVFIVPDANFQREPNNAYFFSWRKLLEWCFENLFIVVFPYGGNNLIPHIFFPYVAHIYSVKKKKK